MKVRTQEAFIWLDTDTHEFVVEVPEGQVAQWHERREWDEAKKRGEYVNVGDGGRDA